MAIDNRLIALTSLNQFFVDKDTGAPLSGGTLEFYKDKNHAASKDVYKLEGTQPDYSYTNIGAVITLGADGTAQDSSGNNIIIYGFPYTDTPSETSTTLDLYYIVCKDSGGGIQWTRDAIPTITSEGDLLDEDLPTSNQISNPQFSRTFLNSGSNAITIQSKTNYEVNIAPDWVLVLTGTGTVTVTQTAESGNDNLPTLPPFSLSVAVGSGITSCLLRQRLNNNSSLWGASATYSTNTGRVSTYVVAKADSSRDIKFQYKDNSQSAITLQTMSLTTSWAAYSEVVNINSALSSTTSSTGYIDLYFDITTNATLYLTSVQLIPTPTSSQSGVIPYDQRSSNRELAYMGDYYLDALSKRGTSNILIGWDFPLNPAQPGLTGTISSNSETTNGAYTWDQTICARSGSNNITYARSSLTNGMQFTTTGATTSLTMMQYLDPTLIYELQGEELSVNVVAHTAANSDVVGRIYLVYAPNGSSIPTLPTTIGTTNSGGVFTPSASGWVTIPRQYLPTPQFTVIAANGRQALTNNTIDYGFNGWKIDGTLAAQPEYFAIVVTFEIPTSGTVLTVDSINMSVGSIPSRPFPLSKTQVVQQCQRYYEKSYNEGTTPGTSAASTAFVKPQNVIVFDVGGNAMFRQRTPFTIDFQTTKRANPTVTLYSPSAGTSGRLDIFTNVNNVFAGPTLDVISTNWAETKKSHRCVSYEPKVTTLHGFGATPTTVNNTGQATVNMHYVADARLGIV